MCVRFAVRFAFLFPDHTFRFQRNIICVVRGKECWLCPCNGRASIRVALPHFIFPMTRPSHEVAISLRLWPSHGKLKKCGTRNLLNLRLIDPQWMKFLAYASCGSSLRYKFLGTACDSHTNSCIGPLVKRLWAMHMNVCESVTLCESCLGLCACAHITAEWTGTARNSLAVWPRQLSLLLLLFFPHSQAFICLRLISYCLGMNGEEKVKRRRKDGHIHFLSLFSLTGLNSLYIHGPVREKNKRKKCVRTSFHFSFIFF